VWQQWGFAFFVRRFHRLRTFYFKGNILMTNQKFNYHVSVNHVQGVGKLVFSYAQTRDIALLVNNRGASIVFQTSKNYFPNFEQSYVYNLAKEGVKRAALLYLLQYQKPLVIRNVLITISRSGKTLFSVDITDIMTFYQMFDGKLLRSVNAEWEKTEIKKRILEYRKSNSELTRSIASLYAYLFSKTKNKETEKFSYLWIAMDGFFVSVSKMNRDRDAMNTFLQKYELGTTVLKGYERNKVCESATFELLKIPEPVTAENIEDDQHKSFSEFVRGKVAEYEKKDFDVTPYGFLLTDYPYYLRCTLFHAEHPMELFSFESDWELKSLRIVNNLIENFLDNNLHMLFSHYS